MKLKLINEVRQMYGLPLQDKVFFTKEEAEVIFNTLGVSGTFKNFEYGFEAIPGWRTQNTVNNHCNIGNLANLLKQFVKKEEKESLRVLVDLMPKALINKTQSIYMVDNKLILELR